MRRVHLDFRVDGTEGFITAAKGLETKNSLRFVYEVFHLNYYVTRCLIFFIMWF